MSTTKIRSKKSTYIFYLVLTLGGAITTLCFLYFTDTFPGLKTKIAGTVAAFILLIGSWNLLRQVQTNPIKLLITSEKIGFYKGIHWKEISLISINSYNFENFYNGYEYVRQLILKLTTDEQEVVQLNGLDINQEELEKILKEKKSW